MYGEDNEWPNMIEESGRLVCDPFGRNALYHDEKVKPTGPKRSFERMAFAAEVTGFFDGQDSAGGVDTRSLQNGPSRVRHDPDRWLDSLTGAIGRASAQPCVRIRNRSLGSLKRTLRGKLSLT